MQGRTLQLRAHINPNRLAGGQVKKDTRAPLLSWPWSPCYRDAREFTASALYALVLYSPSAALSQHFGSKPAVWLQASKLDVSSVVDQGHARSTAATPRALRSSIQLVQLV